MTSNQLFIFICRSLIVAGFLLSAVSSGRNIARISRNNFPANFSFGTASSAYQYEGAAWEAGRRPSIWDIYTHIYPENIADRSNGDVAIDSYHRYREDVHMMKETGFDSYRFSISWSRILPTGKLSGGVNKEGVKYYNDLINYLLAKGIQPFVTLFHWDLPQALLEEYGGFMSPYIVDDFRDYSELCFKEFGDRVKYWITLNEPFSFSNGGYAAGSDSPDRCSAWQRLNCTGGDSGIEPYIVTHHQLLAHAAAAKLYKEKYQAIQEGKIGITLVTKWMLPISNAKRDQDAAQRALDFEFGWFMDPIYTGDYPSSMRIIVGDRLPKFSKWQSEMLKGSYDFLGLNYYTARYVADMPVNTTSRPSYTTDAHVELLVERNGIPIGPKTGSTWLYVYPEGLYDFVMYVKRKYHDPRIYITENGVSEKDDPTLTLEEALADNHRIDFYHQHLSFLQKAIRDGVNVKGYFAWSLMDNFEWVDGYSVRFGIYYVDYKNGLRRYPKYSAYWFKNFMKKNTVKTQLVADI